MTSQELIKAIHQLYMDAQKAKRVGSRIYRGNIHSVSGDAEDQFAIWLDSVIKPGKDFTILVDTCITLNSPAARTGTGKPKRPQIKPDICVIDGKGKVRMLCELKMDTGYMREGFTDYAQKRHEQLAPFRIHDAHYKKGTEGCLAKFNKQLCWHYIIFSEKNNPRQNMEKIEHAFKAKSVPGKLFILSRKRHLDSSKTDYEINKSAFNALEKIVKSLR